MLKRQFVLASALLLSACATLPNGPSVMALPGTGKAFDAFRADDAVCRQYAYQQIGGTTAAQATHDSAVRSAVVGTVIGTAVGAAVGGREGAAVGAGSGLLVGSVSGAGAAENSAYSAQERYNNAYVQCMYAKGNRVPVSGHFETVPSNTSHRTSSAAIPPPPAGYPPPPPSGVVR
ncbi:YMGG-like glycine zipper-containing protein [Sulfuriferula sp.]|uniref:YMGG-like glycine zipper-containing protein n=1 Tax=Sulfuriferula sp. TaxID=2025307 RepID=UPI002731CF88|nr:YMGG-like glycine zipper-containing protein [Sulfuriferula sp.]MDP2025335.1 glycine zipper family protein [Sulfuriferula sp.]